MGFLYFFGVVGVGWWREEMRLVGLVSFFGHLARWPWQGLDGGDLGCY